jgi:hypothetical protein
LKNNEERERKGGGEKGIKEKGDPENGNYHSQLMEAESVTDMPADTHRITEAYPKLSEPTAGTEKGQKVVLHLLLSNKIC